MSAAQQAKAKRRQMANGYAHMGNSLRRPTCIKKAATASIHSAIAIEAARAARMRRAQGGKKK